MQPSQTMHAIIEQAYQTFSRYPVPQQFDVCLGCCVSIADERAMRQTPLRHWPWRLMHEYVGNAPAGAHHKSEIAYLLPRLLEVVAQGEYPGISQEICLRCIDKAAPQTWSQAEQQLLADYARQFVIDLLAQAEADAKLALLDDTLIMFYLAGLDVVPLLDAALAQRGFWQIASLAFFLYMDRSNGEVDNAFVSHAKGRALHQRINSWIEQHSRDLSASAAEAIAHPPGSLAEKYEQYYCQMNLGYWIEESLCALHDQQLLWTVK